jgi:HD-like signal output (HDOD) protein
MKRILFVDDERRVLDGLRRMLRGVGSRWDLAFANSGEEALTMLKATPADVVVSDMRMPGMDGAQLFGRLKLEHPGIIRIILSGYSEVESVMRSTTTAHQFLSKPCDADGLVRLIERSLAIEELFTEPRIRDAVGSIHTLPSVPAIYQELTAVLADPESRIESVAGIVGRDVALVAKILHLANSSFFGVARRLDTVKEAVSYLGFNTIKTLALSFSIMEQFKSNGLPEGFSLEEVQEHSLRVGSLARQLVQGEPFAEQALLVGILHDVGKLILATRLPELYTRIERLGRESGRPAHLIERRAVGASHAEIGAYLLGLWGLPHQIVEGVLFHHEPLKVVDKGFGVAGSVHVADALIREITGTSKASLLDQEYLAALGPLADLERWRSLAHELLAAKGQAA